MKCPKCKRDTYSAKWETCTACPTGGNRGQVIPRPAQSPAEGRRDTEGVAGAQEASETPGRESVTVTPFDTVTVTPDTVTVGLDSVTVTVGQGTPIPAINGVWERLVEKPRRLHAERQAAYRERH